MVMTPLLPSPANNSAGVAMPMNPATTRAHSSASTAGTRPLTIAASVTTTMTAAMAGMAVSLARRYVDGHDS